MGATAYQQPCPGCCDWSGYDCVPSSCPQCEDCIKNEVKHTCRCECNVECGCDGKTCPGCCKCEDCACVDDDSKCTGCKSCSIYDCNCFDDHSKCPENSECCNGVCCSENDCNYCDANDNCVSFCDPDKVCCDGVCMYKCEDEIVDSTTCHGTSYDCSNSCDVIDCEPTGTTTVYENIDLKTCQDGCPGDCPEPSSVLCYTEYDCVRDWIPPYFDFLCNFTTGSCFTNPDEGMVCFLCKQDSEGDPHYEDSAECQ